MFLSAKTTFSVNSETSIGKKEPNGLFGKLFHSLTSGAFSKEELKQTYYAVDVIQGVYEALTDLGINNIISLSRDGIICYLDDSSVDDDLTAAIYAFQKKFANKNIKPFRDLLLTLEYENEGIHYYIDIDVKRAHSANKAPIVISVNGLLSEFKQKAIEPVFLLKARIKETINSSGYNKFVNKKHEMFSLFNTLLIHSVEKKLNLSVLDKTVKSMVIKPKLRGNVSEKNRTKHHPIISGAYYNQDCDWVYMLLWIQILEDSSYDHDFDVIDEFGAHDYHYEACSDFPDKKYCIDSATVNQFTEDESTGDFEYDRGSTSFFSHSAQTTKETDNESDDD